MTFRYLHPAQAELYEAITYYDEQRPGLGAEFLLEVRRTLDLILENPNAWPRLSEEIRGCATRRFPYRVLYAVEQDDVLVIAIMHARRRPGYWKGRT